MNGLRCFLFGLLMLVCSIGSAKTADVMLSELLQTYTTYSASFTQQTMNSSAQVANGLWDYGQVGLLYQAWTAE